MLATHAYMNDQTLFNAFLAIDPSLGTWDVETMDKKVDETTENSHKRCLYIATANWGKRNLYNRDRHVRLYEALNRKSVGTFSGKLEYFEDESHSSVPLVAFCNGKPMIFEGFVISYRDVDSLEQLNQHSQAISDRLSGIFSLPENLINRIRYLLL